MASTNTSAGLRQSDHPLGRRAAWPWAEFALILMVCFVASGAPAPHVNETHYLLKAKHYWDPSFCPSDLFLDSADAHLPFYWTVGWLTKWLPLEAVAWVGRVAAWSLIAAGWIKVSHAVTDARWAAPLSALAWLMLVDKFDFAGEWVVGGLIGKGGVEGKCFAYGFALFGLASLAAGRWTAPWIWFGAAAAMHVLVGGWAVLAGLGVWITEPRATRGAVRTLLPGLLAGGAIALVGLLPALALDRNATPAQAAEAARVYVYERLPHHLAPHTLEADAFRDRCVRFGVLVVGFAGLGLWLAQRGERPANDDLHDGDEAWRPQALGRVMRFATMALIGSCVGMVLELALDNQPLVAARWLRFYWYRQADVMVPAAVALAGSCVAVDGFRQRKSWAPIAVIAAVVLCGWRLGSIAVDRWQNPYPPALARMEDPDAWLAACTWIREHAPADAVCLIPRHGQSFKWYAERADVVNWKDVPQDAAGVIEWRRRLHDVYPTVSGSEGPLVLNSPESWGAQRVLDVARRYGATYVVARSEPPLGLREVYAANSGLTGGGYAVYQIDPPQLPKPASATP